MSIHSFDTRFADSLSNENSEFKMMCPYPLKNVIRIRLASVEIPLIEYGISPSKGNDSFRIKIADAINNPAAPWLESGIIAPGNYNAAQLCAAVEGALLSLLGGFTVSINPLSGLITIENSNNPFIIDMTSKDIDIKKRPTHWGIGYTLGFREQVVQATKTTPTSNIYSIVSDSVPDLLPVPYYLLQIKCPESAVNVYHRTYNRNYIEAFAKIVLNGSSFDVQFTNSSDFLLKEFTFISPVTIPFFHFKLLDPWGKPPSILNAYWSLSMEVTVITNANSYGEIAKTYAIRN